MADKQKYYWDSCIWIALINREAERFAACSYFLEQAQRGRATIWTSSFTLAEVCKNIPNGDINAKNPPIDVAFDQYLLQEFINPIDVTLEIAACARKLMRDFGKLIGKPQDAVHVATAILNNVDELHSFDEKHLLSMNEKIAMQNGKMLKICCPVMPPGPDDGTLFERFATDHDKTGIA